MDLNTQGIGLKIE
jgi:hypothetical protein